MLSRLCGLNMLKSQNVLRALKKRGQEEKKTKKKKRRERRRNERGQKEQLSGSEQASHS